MAKPTNDRLRTRHLSAERIRVPLLVAGALLAAACGAETPAPLEVESGCEGACDGAGGIRELITNPDELDTGDLFQTAAKFATDELNDLLRFRHGDARVGGRIDSTEIYAADERAEDDLTLHSIDRLVSGLARRYGERELTTEVNRLRQDYLRDNDEGHTVYGDTSFRLDARFAPMWSMSVDSFGLGDAGNGRLHAGFLASKDLEGRFVAPYASEVEALTRGNALAAVFERRNFILGRTLDELRKMKPGEMFAWSGAGRTGLRFGASAPLLAYDIGSGGFVNVLFDLDLNVAFRTDTLDVQAIRLGGDELVVDVGFRDVEVDSVRVAVRGGIGVDDPFEGQIDVGGYEIDLGELAEDALESLLTKRFEFLNAYAGRESETEHRMTVARLRFQLDEGNAGGFGRGKLEKALSQALHGDVRAAQYLHNQGHPGVRADFDLSRSSFTQTSTAGLELFGMRFFSERTEGEGHILVQSPDEVRSILYDYLEHDRGAFWWSRRFARTGLSGLRLRPGHESGMASYFLQIQDVDATLDRNKLLDHMDGVLLAVGGREVLDALEPHGNELQDLVDRKCRPATSDCKLAVLRSDKVVALRQRAFDAVETAIADLPRDQQQLVRGAAEYRIAAQSVPEQNVTAAPDMDVMTDLRLTDGALTHLMAIPGEELAASVGEYLRYAAATRHEGSSLETERDEVVRDNEALLDEMAHLWDLYRSRYNQLLGLEHVEVAGLGKLGPRGMVIEFDRDAPDMYEAATARALPSYRSQTVTELFDRLMELAGEVETNEILLSLPPERVVGYGVMNLLPAPRSDVNFRVRFHGGLQIRERPYREAGYRDVFRHARGSGAGIGGEIFDIDALLPR